MQLCYEILTISNLTDVHDVQRKLGAEYDFAYSPHFRGYAKLFRDHLPLSPGDAFPVTVLLFRYEPEDADQNFHDSIAAQDINAALEYLGIVGLDQDGLWEWKTCLAAEMTTGRLSIKYHYDRTGGEHRIVYDLEDVATKDTVLVTALEAIIECCRMAESAGDDKVADRIGHIAINALNRYERRP